MKRAAIYARFSTELQNERSIEDQVAVCRNYAERNDLEVVGVFHDRARSGASIYGRDGLLRLLEAARDGAFDVIVVEALDRLSRDQEDLAGIWKRLNFVGVELRAVHEGTADQIQIGVRGLLASLFLTDLAHKVRRGMQGVVRDGRHAGGRAYGYRPVAGKPGELEIVESEAGVIRRIFRDYVDGKTPREIAHALNREGVSPPRGSNWTPSTINGNKKRHHGIILNELYAGVVVWNRVRMIKDPDTGRRVSRSNPPEEWKRAHAPRLAIVDKDVFEAAQQRKAQRSFEPPERVRKAKFLLSGLLKCGCCGGGMSMKDRDHGRVRVHCSTMKEAGTCANRKIFYLDEIEKAVLTGLQQHLKAPELLREFVASYQEERLRLAAEKVRQRGRLESRLAEVQRTLDRLWSDYEKERVPTEVLGPQMKEAHQQKVALLAELETQPEPEKVLALHPAALQHYERLVGQLNEVFGRGVTPDNEEAAEKIRELVAKVVVKPAEEGFKLELQGRLAMLMGAAKVYPNMRIAASGGRVVAEEGFEPPTQGL
ncbi:recombinase family protein [Methylocystis bryophila]|uniref:Recombinase family protein n=1 Tax=Methylocystis bryophila TaxID=655015 RepID=A0A1W6N0Z8_9HYPH|nr:recombinase family protein [Methylocystis bryophila]ARN83497.1 recombinase family protein [Methylocystis bryophila]BDV37011.1 recombinase [Methylocystis bryophila]